MSEVPSVPPDNLLETSESIESLEALARELEAAIGACALLSKGWPPAFARQMIQRDMAINGDKLAPRTWSIRKMQDVLTYLTIWLSRLNSQLQSMQKSSQATVRPRQELAGTPMPVVPSDIYLPAQLVVYGDNGGRHVIQFPGTSLSDGDITGTTPRGLVILVKGRAFHIVNRAYSC